MPDLLPLLAALVLVLMGARLGGALATALGQPAVMGELLAGVALGNAGLVGLHAVENLRDLSALDSLGQIGALFLLFSVGLQSEVGRLLAVGRSAALVALLGVAAPLALGVAASAAWQPGRPALVHAFVGATLAATSVGITARVLADLGRASGPEGRIIVGAAVLDDVLALVVLAVATGAVRDAAAGRPFGAAGALAALGRAAGFLLAAGLLGRAGSRVAFAAASRLRGEGLLLSVALAFCFLLAWLAGVAGLAPIVGAFAAGLVLEEVHYRELLEREPRARALEDLLGPLSQFLVPVFFVLVGMKVDLRSLAAPGVPAFAALLTAAAVLGKQACSLGVLERGADRVLVGLGMVPRGEVGLVFASVGAQLRLGGGRVLDDRAFAALVLAVAATTLVTPPLLSWRLRAPRPPA